MGKRATVRHFGALDFYRFVAAFGVACLHFSQLGNYDRASGFGSAVGNFGLFVDFFFILSGFVIGVSYFKSVNSTREVLTFFRRRIARIYPMYFITLMFFTIPAIVTTSQHPERYAPSKIIQEFFLVQSWPIGAQLPLNFPAWSVSAEWAMYLLFPAIVWLCRSFSMAALFLFIVPGFWYFDILLGGGGDHSISHLWSNPLRAIPTFATGILISQSFQLIRMRFGVALGFVAFCGGVTLAILHANPYLIVAAFSLTILLTASGYASSGSPTILDSKFCRELGNASYSLYMLHALVLTIFVIHLWPRLSSSPPPLIYGAGLAVLTVTASIFSFRYFERPARDLISGRVILPSPATSGSL